MCVGYLINFIQSANQFAILDSRLGAAYGPDGQRHFDYLRGTAGGADKYVSREEQP